MEKSVLGKYLNTILCASVAADVLDLRTHGCSLVLLSLGRVEINWRVAENECIDYHLPCPTVLCLHRYMDYTARQVLVLRKPNKNLQQVWCPTRLSRLQLQMQQLARLRVLSRVTRFREPSDNTLVPSDCTFSPVTVFYKYFYVQNSTHGMYISCSLVHGLKPEKLVLLFT